MPKRTRYVVVPHHSDPTRNLSTVLPEMGRRAKHLFGDNERGTNGNRARYS